MDIKVVPADFDATKADLERVHSSLKQYKSNLENAYSQLAANCEGQFAKALGAHIPKMFANYEAVNQKMKRVAEAIQKAKEEYVEVDKANAALVGGGMR